MRLDSTLLAEVDDDLSLGWELACFGNEKDLLSLDLVAGVDKVVDARELDGAFEETVLRVLTSATLVDCVGDLVDFVVGLFGKLKVLLCLALATAVDATSTGGDFGSESDRDVPLRRLAVWVRLGQTT